VSAFFSFFPLTPPRGKEHNTTKKKKKKQGILHSARESEPGEQNAPKTTQKNKHTTLCFTTTVQQCVSRVA